MSFYKDFIINKADALIAIRQDDSPILIRYLSEREIKSYQMWLPELKKTYCGTWSKVMRWLKENVP